MRPMEHPRPESPGRSRERLLTEAGDSLFRVAWHCGQDASNAFAALGMNPLRAVALGLIARGTDHPGELARALALSPPSVSQLLRDLTDRGLVARRHDDADRRRVALSLTAAGRDVLDELRTRWLHVNASRLDRLGDEDLATLHRIHTVLLEQA